MKRRIFAFSRMCKFPLCNRPATFDTNGEIQFCAMHWRVWWSVGEAPEFWIKFLPNSDRKHPFGEIIVKLMKKKEGEPK